MIANPQRLIDLNHNLLTDFSENTDYLPDAIYIPFLNKYKYLNDLLLSLNWFEKEIIILVSDVNNKSKIDTTNNYKVSFINYSKYKVTKKILNLKTFKTANFLNYINEWDLPVKRNFALLHAIENEFDRILFIDDDIEGITKEIINKGIAALESNNISGCLVHGFPDTSVIGHIKLKYGGSYYPFLSGNFLFIKTAIIDSFFPLIYNEDWLFMIPSIKQKKVSSVDTIYQKRHDPFNNISRIKLQEFGEVIAEGLFVLIAQTKYEDRYSANFWDDYIKYRRSYIAELLDHAENIFISFIKESLAICDKIKSRHCIDFIQDWENDIFEFQEIKLV